MELLCTKDRKMRCGGKCVGRLYAQVAYEPRYLTFEKKHEEFTVIKVNLNIIRKDDEEYLYNEDDPYSEPNNARYHNII